MAYTPINLTQAQQSYSAGTQANVQKWQANTGAAAQTWFQNATSSQAEANYAAGIQIAINNQTRLKGLQASSAAEFQQGVQGAGGQYQARTQAKSGKWMSKFQPYAQLIDGLVPGLPAKIPGQARQNTINRSAPIGEALQQAKMSGAIMAQAPMPMSQPIMQQTQYQQPQFYR